MGFSCDACFDASNFVCSGASSDSFTIVNKVDENDAVVCAQKLPNLSCLDPVLVAELIDEVKAALKVHRSIDACTVWLFVLYGCG